VLTHPTRTLPPRATKECGARKSEREQEKILLELKENIGVEKGFAKNADAPALIIIFSREQAYYASDDLILAKLKSTGVKIIEGVPFSHSIYCLGDNEILFLGRVPSNFC
jgi:hypothetical protein